MSSLSSYYIFYLIDKFRRVDAGGPALSVHLPCRERGRARSSAARSAIASAARYVIWFSILGALPFTLALPYAGLACERRADRCSSASSSPSATSSIIVFAQELVPHRFGMISGVFFGVAFGIGGLGAAVLGKLADHTGIAFVYHLCAFLPALGLLAVFCRDTERRAERARFETAEGAARAS